MVRKKKTHLAPTFDSIVICLGKIHHNIILINNVMNIWVQ